MLSILKKQHGMNIVGQGGKIEKTKPPMLFSHGWSACHLGCDLYQVERSRFDDRLRPAVYLEFLQDCMHVKLHCPLGEHKLFSDLAV